MKLSTPEDVINYFFYLIPLNETVRARKKDDNLIIYDKYNNSFLINIETLSEATKNG